MSWIRAGQAAFIKHRFSKPAKTGPYYSMNVEDRQQIQTVSKPYSRTGH